MKVTAIHIVKDREVESTDTLIFELPEKLESRRLLFEIDRREVQEEFGPAVEAGQRFFMMWWD